MHRARIECAHAGAAGRPGEIWKLLSRSLVSFSHAGLSGLRCVVYGHSSVLFDLTKRFAETLAWALVSNQLSGRTHGHINPRPGRERPHSAFYAYLRSYVQHEHFLARRHGSLGPLGITCLPALTHQFPARSCLAGMYVAEWAGRMACRHSLTGAFGDALS